MIIGTHNSMTYLRPARWYGWLMIPFARCQSKTLVKQYAAGARCFDIRIRFEKSGRPYFAHGLLALKGNVHDSLRELERLADDGCQSQVYVRLVLEDPRCQRHNEIYFREFCETLFIDDYLFLEYPLLRFFQGNRKGDWAQIFEFPYKPKLYQPVSSMASDARWYEKFIPWLYARRCNRRNKPQPDITIYDFI